MVTWSAETHGTGVALVDEQHQQLFSMINILLDERRWDTAKVKSLVTFLGQYIEKHFREEEELMEARKCPAATLNKAEHARFRENFKALVGDIDRGGLTEDLTRRLRHDVLDWLVNHIVKVDRQLLLTVGPAATTTPVPAPAPKSSGSGLFGWVRGILGNSDHVEGVGGIEHRELHGLNFAHAVESHNGWRERLAAVVAGSSTEGLVAAHVGLPDQCELGAWLGGLGQQKFGHEASFQQLKTTHTAFHGQLQRIVALSQAGHVGEARGIFEGGDYIIHAQRLRSQLAGMYIELNSGRLKAK